MCARTAPRPVPCRLTASNSRRWASLKCTCSIGSCLLSGRGARSVPHFGLRAWARVSSADQQDDVTRQMQRLRDDVAPRGYQVVAAVTEIVSGLNDEQPKRKTLLTAAKVGVSVVEQRDRLILSSPGS